MIDRPIVEIQSKKGRVLCEVCGKPEEDWAHKVLFCLDRFDMLFYMEHKFVPHKKHQFFLSAVHPGRLGQGRTQVFLCRHCEDRCINYVS